MNIRRWMAVVLGMALVVGGTSACHREKNLKNAVKIAIDRTARRAHKFAYVDKAGTITTTVSGVVEDDYRYKAGLNVNGLAVSEEVVDDDALAVRFLEPSALASYLAVDPAAAASAALVAGTASTDLTKPTPQLALAGLSTRRWVLDPIGAPQLLNLGTDKREQGDDPVFDGLTALQYVRDAVDRGRFVKKYSSDSIDPVFKANQDPFPKPKNGSQVIRYDVKPPALPAASARGGGNQTTPETANFRKLVVYVRDGYVIEAREEIDVASRLDDLIASFRLPRNTTVEQAVSAINAVRKGQGTDTIRVRKLRLQISDISAHLKVELPIDRLPGDLRVLKYRGRQQAPGARVPTA